MLPARLQRPPAPERLLTDSHKQAISLTIMERKIDRINYKSDFPAQPEGAYRAEAERLIALRYTTGQEIQFAREKEAVEGYAAYLEYVEECKVRAREEASGKSTKI